MIATEPERLWWTAVEIAGAGLPDLPGTKRRVNDHAERMGWARDPARARRRKGRGGGWEYHWTLFPERARQRLLIAAAPRPETPTAAPIWSGWETATETMRDKARMRLRILQLVEAMHHTGVGKNRAVVEIGRAERVAPRSIWNWFERVEGVAAANRLPALLSASSPGRGKTQGDIDPSILTLILSDWLRLSKPSLTSCYDRVSRIAESRGLTMPPLHTVRRRIASDVSPQTVTLKREGIEALKRLYPSQVRDKSAMHAMEAVNGDFHRFDVFVKFPADGAGQREEIGRPQMVAFQDVYSGKLLSWRIDRTANSHATQLAIGDMIEDWGIPEHATLDNGREFAAKALTGGARTRFRFKVRDEDIPGLFTQLGTEIHWATPYSGQSKPIERAFRDLCDRIAKHPAFEGAYTGNSPTAKPENYGSRAVPLADFMRVVAEEIELHNTRRGRRSEIAWGRSFAEVFAESYAETPIRKAAPEQRRLWLMGAEGVRASRENGQVRLMRNTYWAPWMVSLAGEKIVARFDKSALWDGIHVYRITGEYVGHAPCTARGAFYDVDDARVHAKARRDWLTAERARTEALGLLTASEVGRSLEDLDPAPEPTPPQAAVVRMIPQARVASQPDVDAETRAEREAVILDLTARQSAPEDREAEDAAARFARARSLEAANEQTLTKEQRLWLERYRKSNEYAGHAFLEASRDGKEGGRAE